jgi:hypothetical protein
MQLAVTDDTMQRSYKQKWGDIDDFAKYLQDNIDLINRFKLVVEVPPMEPRNEDNTIT